MPKTFRAKALTPTLPLQIADQIGAAIVDERLAPGARLKEVDLATTFDVSRATVRDALRILESRKLVRILPQRGAQVALLSDTELEDLFEVRAALLGLVARKAARKRDEISLKRLNDGLSNLRDAVSDGRAYHRASTAMVAELSRAAQSEQLSEQIETFAQRIGRYTRLGLVTQERRNRSVASWGKLVAAIASGNEDLAEEIERKLAFENRDAALKELRRRAIQELMRGATKNAG